MRLVYHLRGIEAINERLLHATRPSWILREFGATIAPDAVVYGPLLIHNAEVDYRNLFIGERAHLGRGVLLDLTEHLSIEADAVVSMGVTILTHADIGERPLAHVYPRQLLPTIIGTASYVGANATVLAGANVGAQAVIGAGAVVTEPVPDYTLAVGVPARMVDSTVSRGRKPS